VELTVVILYIIVATWLSLYGFNAIVISLLYLIHRKDPLILEPLTEFPDVTIQLPVYNERYVVERLLDAVAALDWPHDKLHIQVLDDSTDETTGLVRARADLHRMHGLNIMVLHRADRTGYKAGALKMGLECSTSPFIAIFDADFVPAPNFLKRTIPAFIGRPKVGWVQTRWAHLNENYNPVTRSMALMLDAHFAVEHIARNRSGLPIIFNGSAGVWRRACIESAGGWQSDTLIEDADLSYRAQIAGWQGLSMPEVAVPAELPVQMSALKQQHFRWAKGGGQLLRKLSVPLLKSNRSVWYKLAGLFHLGGYLTFPLIILLLILWLPIILHPDWIDGIPRTFMSIAMLGVPIQYTLGQIALHRTDIRRIVNLPWFMIIGTGMTLSNSLAIFEGLCGRPSTFMRTPKFRMEGDTEAWKNSAYVMSADPTAFGEVMMVGYAAFMTLESLRLGNLSAIPFLLLYVVGFATVAIGIASDSGPRRRRSTVRAKADA
jgi:cellulose synthase/poly-beta-1,6-N-acetylglucosamine synthase-like glycosyltransferase